MANNFSVWSKTKLGTKLSIIAFVPFVLTSICILATLSVLADAYAEARTQQRARQMIADCETALDSMIMGGSMMGFYLRNHDPQMLEQFWQTGEDAKACIKDLRENAQDQTPEMVSLIDQLDNHTREMDEIAHSQLSTFHLQRGRKQSLIDLLDFRSKALHTMAHEKELIDEIEASINAQMNTQPVQHSPLYLLLRHNIVLAVGISIFGSLSLALLLARSIVSRLRLLTQKAIRLALLEAPETPARGSDEIAQVDHVFNDMAFQLLNAIKREQAAIACAADVIISIAPDGTVLGVNNALTGSCGWEADDLVGKSIFEFLSQADRAPVQQAITNRPAANFEASVLRRDGKALPCLWSTSWSPGEQCTIAIVHDVSERKAAEDNLRESEARTRSVMEHMPAGLLLISERGLVRFANETACRLLAKTREGLIDSQFTSLLSATNMQSPEAFVELLSQRLQPYVAEFTKDDGSDGRVQLSLSKFAMAKEQQE
ncbi:MAG TPA: PAS domain S-box protein, partial [Candidatus Obscuribacterales bacterium]